MKNLDIISKKSENATWENPVPIYYDYYSDEVLTKDMITDNNKHIMFCTDLIRPNSELEIKIAVYRALKM